MSRGSQAPAGGTMSGGVEGTERVAGAGAFASGVAGARERINKGPGGNVYSKL